MGIRSTCVVHLSTRPLATIFRMHACIRSEEAAQAALIGALSELAVYNILSHMFGALSTVVRDRRRSTEAPQFDLIELFAGYGNMTRWGAQGKHVITFQFAWVFLVYSAASFLKASRAQQQTARCETLVLVVGQLCCYLHSHTREQQVWSAACTVPASI